MVSAYMRARCPRSNPLHACAARAGAMEHGVRHGRGTYTFGASGAAYDGDYVQGVRQGRGSIRFPDGGKYEGARGSVLAGAWCKQVAPVEQGTAQIAAATSRSLGAMHPTGGWAADKMEGQGTYTYKCGDMFCGGFKGGKKEGAGVYHCKVRVALCVGCTHTGACGAQHCIVQQDAAVVGQPPSWLAVLGGACASPLGQAASMRPDPPPRAPTQADGAQYHGTWVDGDMVEGRFMHRDGSMFAGTFEASKPVRCCDA